MFASVRQAQPSRQVEIQKTNAKVTQLTPELTNIFKKSLKSNRWDHINLGAAAEYTHENMVNRWVQEKNKWLKVSLIVSSFSPKTIVCLTITRLFLAENPVDWRCVG